MAQQTGFPPQPQFAPYPGSAPAGFPRPPISGPVGATPQPGNPLLQMSSPIGSPFPPAGFPPAGSAPSLSPMDSFGPQGSQTGPQSGPQGPQGAPGGGDDQQLMALLNALGAGGPDASDNAGGSGGGFLASAKSFAMSAKGLVTGLAVVTTALAIGLMFKGGRRNEWAAAEGAIKKFIGGTIFRGKPETATATSDAKEGIKAAFDNVKSKISELLAYNAESKGAVAITDETRTAFKPLYDALTEKLSEPIDHAAKLLSDKAGKPTVYHTDNIGFQGLFKGGSELIGQLNRSDRDALSELMVTLRETYLPAQKADAPQAVKDAYTAAKKAVADHIIDKAVVKGLKKDTVEAAITAAEAEVKAAEGEAKKAAEAKLAYWNKVKTEQLITGTFTEVTKPVAPATAS